MAKKNSFFSRYRFVYKPSPILLKCALLTMLVIGIGALTILRICNTQENQHLNAVRVQAAQYEQKNQEITWMIKNKDTVEGIKSISEDKMGMVEGDAVFYDVVTNQD